MTDALGNVRERLGSVFSRGQAVSAGATDYRIRTAAEAGTIVALGGGWYRWADVYLTEPELAEIVARSPRGTLCLETTLARHELIDSIPLVLDVALPRKAHRPVLAGPFKLHWFAEETFDIGREVLGIGADLHVGIYNAPRSLIDVVQQRSATGTDLVWQALRRWLGRPGNHPGELIRLARQFPRAERPLRDALEILL